jgi:hypothetical protein
LLILAEPKEKFAAGDDQARDLGVVDAAEQLRNLAGATDLVSIRSRSRWKKFGQGSTARLRRAASPWAWLSSTPNVLFLSTG